jgi:hypothetical protein
VRNVLFIGIVSLVCGYVVVYPAWAGLAKDKTQGIRHELGNGDTLGNARLDDRSTRETASSKTFDDATQVAQAPPRSNRCVTQVVACILPAYFPVGTQCWCATPYGPAGGYVK